MAYIEEFFDKKSPFQRNSVSVNKISVDRETKKIVFELTGGAFDLKATRSADEYIKSYFSEYTVEVKHRFLPESFDGDAFFYVIDRLGELRSLFRVCFERREVSISDGEISVSVDKGAAGMLKSRNFALLFNEKCAEIFSRTFVFNITEAEFEAVEQAPLPEAPPEEATQETMY